MVGLRVGLQLFSFYEALAFIRPLSDQMLIVERSSYNEA
jgi:hypothetical protein